MTHPLSKAFWQRSHFVQEDLASVKVKSQAGKDSLSLVDPFGIEIVRIQKQGETLEAWALTGGRLHAAGEQPKGQLVIHQGEGDLPTIYDLPPSMLLSDHLTHYPENVLSTLALYSRDGTKIKELSEHSDVAEIDFASHVLLHRYPLRYAANPREKLNEPYEMHVMFSNAKLFRDETQTVGTGYIRQTGFIQNQNASMRLEYIRRRDPLLAPGRVIKELVVAHDQFLFPESQREGLDGVDFKCHLSNE
jgi:hypothetical protein